MDDSIDATSSDADRPLRIRKLTTREQWRPPAGAGAAVAIDILAHVIADQLHALNANHELALDSLELHLELREMEFEDISFNSGGTPVFTPYTEYHHDLTIRALGVER